MTVKPPDMEAYQKAVLALAADPLRFVSLCWPDMQLYPKQEEILLSLRDHVETFVHAANETGKTRIVAVGTLWFFASRTPARVVTSSSSETQLGAILWSEIHSLIHASRFPLPFVVKTLCLKKIRRLDSMETEPSDYVLGYVTNATENFQGHHLPNDRPRVLAVFDEASGVPDEFFEAADSWAHRKLVIGNPLSTTNFFYRSCRGGDVADPAGEADLLRKVIHIDGRDSPNVQAGFRWKELGKPGSPPVLIPGLLTYEEYVRREQQWNEVQRTTRLHGHFYEGDQAVVFPAQWLDAAMDAQRWRELQEEDRHVEAIGVDVAAGGRDNTCWTLVDSHGVIDQIVLDTPNTMEIVGRTIQLIREHNLSARRVAFDAGGGGKQIGDRLREQNYHVQLIGFGESADAKQAYRNKRAELYGKLREYLNPERESGVFALPPDADQLRRELAVLPLQYDSEGRMQLLPKESRGAGQQQGPCLRQLLGHSPDRADSLALAVWTVSRPRRKIPTVDHPLVFTPTAENMRPLTPEQLAAYPEPLRGVMEMYQHPRYLDGWRDDDWDF